jgi:hypothetical protein
MSLINDALKRAKQAQAQASPSVAAGPQLRPVESVPHTHRSLGLLLPATIIVLLGIGLFFVWGRFHTGPKANTNSQIVNNTKPASAPEPPSIQPATTAAAAAAPPQKTTQGSSSKEQGETVVFGPPSGGQTVAPDSKPSVQQAAISVASVEKPGAAGSYPLRLTGIVFHPTHPAAMIGGKTLFINDKVGEWRVVAIDRESATLSKAGQTNVLTLAP